MDTEQILIALVVLTAMFFAALAFTAYAMYRFHRAAKEMQAVLRKHQFSIVKQNECIMLIDRGLAGVYDYLTQKHIREAEISGTIPQGDPHVKH